MTFIASLFVMYCKESGFKNFEIGAAVLKTTLQFLFYFMFAMRFLEFLKGAENVIILLKLKNI